MTREEEMQWKSLPLPDSKHFFIIIYIYTYLLFLLSNVQMQFILTFFLLINKIKIALRVNNKTLH